MNCKLISFGHKYGKPDADLLISVVDMPGPSKELRKYNGQNKRLQKELFENPEFSMRYKQIVEQVQSFLNNNSSDMITIAIGCEKGKHRSVAIVEKLVGDIGSDMVQHRDINRKQDMLTKKREYDLRRNEKYIINNDL